MKQLFDLINLKCYRMVGVGGRSPLNNSRALLVCSSEYCIACQPLKGYFKLPCTPIEVTESLQYLEGTFKQHKTSPGEPETSLSWSLVPSSGLD